MARKASTTNFTLWRCTAQLAWEVRVHHRLADLLKYVGRQVSLNIGIFLNHSLFCHLSFSLQQLVGIFMDWNSANSYSLPFPHWKHRRSYSYPCSWTYPSWKLNDFPKFAKFLTKNLRIKKKILGYKNYWLGKKFALMLL